MSGQTRLSIEQARQALLGKWRKATTDACAAAYPDEIEFFANATYRG